MSDKSKAPVALALIAIPAMVVCCLVAFGLLGSVVAGTTAYLSGSGAQVALLVGLGFGVIWLTIRTRRRSGTDAGGSQDMERDAR